MLQIWKEFTIKTIYSRSLYLGQERKKYFWETKSFKSVSKQIKPINMILIYKWDKKLKKKKRLHVLEVDIITVKRTLVCCLQLKEWIIYKTLSKMTAIVPVSVINHYHINGLHLFWDTLSLSLSVYIYICIRQTRIWSWFSC